MGVKGTEFLKRYLWNILIALDQLVNTIAGGDPDETISSRLGKARARGSRFAKAVCWLLDLIDKRHCADAIEEDEGGNRIWD